MGIAGAHLSVIMMTSYLNDLNYKLGLLTDRRQAVSAQEAAIIQQYSNNAIQTLGSTSGSSSWVNDPDIQLLELQDNDFDMQQKKMETQIKAISANLDAQQKLLDNNIKKDFAGNMSV